MSSITFKDIHEEAVVGGRERHQCGWWVRQLFEMAVDLPALVEAHWRHEGKILQLLSVTDRRQLDMVLFSCGGGGKRIVERSWDLFEMSLNTAMAIGSDPVRFCARVHGQCEIHGYVEGPNRAWLAEIIDEGLRTKILRHETQGYGEGWEDVAKLLRARDDCPVVTEYSVTGSFPQMPESWREREDCDEWYEIPEEARWETALRELRESGGWLEWQPKNWALVRFGAPAEDAFTLREYLQGQIEALVRKP